MHQTHKTKAYTLLELIIVIIILTLLIWAFRWFMPNKNNKQIDFWKQCSQYIYQEIISDINSFKRNEIETISWTQYSQLSKQVDIDTHEIKIIRNMIDIENNNEEQIAKMIVSWNNCLDQNIINKNNYLIKINTNGSITYLSDNIQISDNNIFEISSCIDTGDNNTCIPSSQIKFNQAAQTIEQKTCTTFSWNTCTEWSQ